ncbi:unnamed protein product [Mytilus coruscus]|uniref:Uncharacterized protein n=1 Tax=Mytilus coruscus TaxID=42192 RepID=A0A6J8DHT7_MYTCO|nr:unnamed protein product [Mytilus coruscus]
MATSYASYAEAASDENKNKNKNDDYKIGNVKPIFLLETDVFGENDMNHIGQRPFLINTEINDQTEDNDESFQDSDVDSKISTKPLLNTKGRSRESKSAGKDNSQQQKEKPKNVKSVDRRSGISRYLTTKPSHEQSNTTNSTPKQSKTKNIEKSPVTPTENLHDATRDEAAKKPKKRR